ncbi:MAG: ThuA domain-containing protein [Lentisphaerae bacterium]|nr:ThuA domain-containing protein [Lentisphaerota bacterium]
MNRVSQKHVVIVLGCLMLALAPRAPAAEKIKVLLIDGQNNHKWQVTTPALKKMLEDTGRFAVEVATTPPRGAKQDAWEKFSPNFAGYDVVLSNYTGAMWPKDVCAAFEKYMAGGGGLVFYHAAVFAFPQWKQWNEMMGMGWRKNNYGDRVTIDDSGKVVRTPKGEGPGGGHGPAHSFEIAVRDKDHPVMKDLPAKWTHAKDELYHGMRGPAKNMHIIATAFSDTKTRGTGTNEPMVWTVPAGKGRVLVTLMGHDVKALTHPGSAAALTRGVEWAATGAVTLPVPKELTAAAKTK